MHGRGPRVSSSGGAELLLRGGCRTSTSGRSISLGKRGGGVLVPELVKGVGVVGARSSRLRLVPRASAEAQYLALALARLAFLALGPRCVRPESLAGTLHPFPRQSYRCLGLESGLWQVAQWPERVAVFIY